MAVNAAAAVRMPSGRRHAVGVAAAAAGVAVGTAVGAAAVGAGDLFHFEVAGVERQLEREGQYGV